MSKKKSFSGSTMTLKDFHGGSIPSDLPLPSAPGIIIRPSDRSGFDRQTGTGWGNPMARSDHRSRPGSSGTTRNFDEKASFLSHPSHIGRNFDEDERKPFDGVSIPKRTVSDDLVRSPQTRPDPKPDPVPTTNFSSTRNLPSPVSHYPAKPTPPGANSQFPGVAGANSQFHGGHNGGHSAPNAWAVRKEVVPEPVAPLAWSGPGAVSRFAQASALEKVSSGRWQSKPSIHHQPDIEVIRFESDMLFVARTDQINDRSDMERVRSPVYLESKERSSLLYSDGARPASTEGKLGGSQFQAQATEVSERPKLKLLPRSKPLEPLEVAYSLDSKQGIQPAIDPVHIEVVPELNGNVNCPKPGSAGAEEGNRFIERPKLNLKPRSQPVEKSDGSVARERKTLFGGARPRELVLKERGVDDVAINNINLSQPVNRVKHDSPRTDMKPESNVPAPRHSERTENSFLDQRITQRDYENTQKSSWRNEHRRNNSKETEKQQERRQEPESWRRPVEPLKPTPTDSQAPRYGRASSALELAQAFSRSISDDRFTSQRTLPGRNQVPFSRLTDTREFYSGPSSRQINGY